MGVKLKFDEEDMLYFIFKYIIDSGVCSLIICGVLVYIVNGNFFFEFVIVKKVWKVRKMLKDEMCFWFFFF